VGHGIQVQLQGDEGQRTPRARPRLARSRRPDNEPRRSARHRARSSRRSGSRRAVSRRDRSTCRGQRSSATG
jgi:hypothetical protein